MRGDHIIPEPIAHANPARLGVHSPRRTRNIGRLLARFTVIDPFSSRFQIETAHKRVRLFERSPANAMVVARPEPIGHAGPTGFRVSLSRIRWYVRGSFSGLTIVVPLDSCF